MLTVDQANDYGDTKPETIFAAALNGEVSGYDTLIDGVLRRPAVARAAGRRRRGHDHAVDRAAGAAGRRELDAVRHAHAGHARARRDGDAALRVRPGHREQVNGAGGQVRGRRRCPRREPAEVGRTGCRARTSAQADRWVARELAWDAYLLRTASVYEEECGAHTITQGGYYQYTAGFNWGFRSWLHYLLPIVYTEPELAREILRYSIKLQPEVPRGVRPVRHRAAVPALRPRHLERPRLLAAACRRRVRPRRARPRVLRRAAAVPRHEARRSRRGSTSRSPTATRSR